MLNNVKMYCDNPSCKQYKQYTLSFLFGMEGFPKCLVCDDELVLEEEPLSEEGDVAEGDGLDLEYDRLLH